MPVRNDQGVIAARPAAAALPLALVGGILAWWGWKSGAYFDVTFLPGAIALLLLLVALLAFAPWPGELRGPARVALLALLGLAGWTLLSALWSPNADVALSDAQRVLTYAVAFALGVWLCLLLGRQMLLALAPIAAAGALVAVGTLLALWAKADPADLFEVDATLRYPLGYRNAVAAFFITSVFPLVTLALEREWDWRLRGALIGAATLAVELVVLAQSRTSVFAAVIAVAVLVLAHPTRLRALGWLALAVGPALLALPWLLEVYSHNGGNTAESLEPLGPACAAIALTTLFSGGLACAVARAEPGLSLSEDAGRRIGQVLVAGVAALLIAGLVTVFASEGGPGGFISRSADQLTAGTPAAGEEDTRFGFDLRSQRGDLWRVAIDDFEANPAVGEGAGGFRPSYLLDRRANDVQPEDPHSVELLMASELGVPGLLLFGAFVVAAVAAALRARRLGPSAAALAAGALAVGAYWFAHASVEWFWTYPAITLPVAFVMGAAAAPALLRPAAPARRARRAALARGDDRGRAQLHPAIPERGLHEPRPADLEGRHRRRVFRSRAGGGPEPAQRQAAGGGGGDRRGGGGAAARARGALARPGAGPGRVDALLPRGADPRRDRPLERRPAAGAGARAQSQRPRGRAARAGAATVSANTHFSGLAKARELTIIAFGGIAHTAIPGRCVAFRAQGTVLGGRSSDQCPTTGTGN